MTEEVRHRPPDERQRVRNNAPVTNQGTHSEISSSITQNSVFHGTSARSFVDRDNSYALQEATILHETYRLFSRKSYCRYCILCGAVCPNSSVSVLGSLSRLCFLCMEIFQQG